jgi:Spy/CpxP family protein refolding chaperone
MSNRRTKSGALAPAALLATILIAAPAAALAQPMGGPPPMGGSPILHSVMKALHTLPLTDDEMKQVHGLMDQYHQSTEARREQMMAAHKVLAGQAVAESFDESAIRSASATFSALQADEIVGEAALLRDIRSVLSSDERDQLQRTLAKMATSDEMPGHWGGPDPHGHGGGPGGSLND